MTIPVGKSEKIPQTPYTKLENADSKQSSLQLRNKNSASLDPSHRITIQMKNKRMVKMGFLLLFFLFLLFLLIILVLTIKFNFKSHQNLLPHLGFHPLPPPHRSSNLATLVAKHKLDNSEEETTVYRNYKTAYETMKAVNSASSVCYVRKLRINDMRNSTAVRRRMQQRYKSHFYDVIVPPPEAKDGVERLIGDNAFEDCKESRILWVEPMPYEQFVTPKAKDVQKDGEEEEEEEDQEFGVDRRASRERRSIRSCRTTCCWRVCCCDVHHFVWQAPEEFNCNHVCNKCSKRYKSVIEKLC